MTTFFLVWHDTKETSCSKSCGANATKTITRLCSHDKDRCMSDFSQNETICSKGGCPVIKDEVFTSPCHFDPCPGILKYTLEFFKLNITFLNLKKD